MPVPEALPGDEARYAYLSTFHWMPLVNGYSGYYPPSYLTRIDRLRAFPGAGSTDVLRRAGVRYVIVHASAYPAGGAGEILIALSTDLSFSQLGHWNDGHGDAVVFRLR